MSGRRFAGCLFFAASLLLGGAVSHAQSWSTDRILPGGVLPPPGLPAMPFGPFRGGVPITPSMYADEAGVETADNIVFMILTIFPPTNLLGLPFIWLLADAQQHRSYSGLFAPEFGGTLTACCFSLTYTPLLAGVLIACFVRESAGDTAAITSVCLGAAVTYCITLIIGIESIK